MTGARTFQRTAALLLIAWGALIVVMSVIGIPKARASDRLMDGARPLVAPAYLAEERALIVEGRAALGQFVDDALPRLATRLYLSPAEMQIRIAVSYPDIAAGIDAMPAIFDTTDASLANLQEHRDDFHDADTFPLSGVSRLTESVGGIVFGALLMALGGLSWLHGRRRLLGAGLVVSLLGAVLPLAFWLPGKARGVQDMAGSLNLTKETAVQTRASFVTVDNFTTQLRDRLVPDLAAAAGTTAKALEAEVEQGLDDLRAGIRDYPTTVRLFTPDVRLREVAYPDFQSVKDVPVVTLTWALIAGNAAVAITAAAGLWTARRREETCVNTPRTGGPPSS